MNCHSYMIYEPKFLNYHGASMTRKELTICPIKFCKCRAASRWFHDLECNYRLWIVTQIWYMSLTFETIMMPRWPEGIDGYKSLGFETIKMPRWPERNWRILFVLLNFVNFINVGMPRWFFDLECNSRLWVPHIKAFSIKSCHSRILRLLHTLSFF